MLCNAMKKKNCFRFLALVLCISLLAGAFAGCKEEQKEEGVNAIRGLELTASQEPLVRWHGRYEYKSDMVMLYHTASGFTVEFYGTELKATFFHQATETGGSDIFYNVAVDDEVIPTAAPERTVCLTDEEMTKTVTLVSGLEEGRHTLTCLKMSEPNDAVTGILDITTDGHFVPRNQEQDQAKLKFMFICASGGSGYGSLVSTEGKNNISRTRANSSSLHAFNYLTARMYDAEVQFVAQAGWGLTFPENRSIYDVFDHTGILGYSENAGEKNSVKGAQTTAKWDHSQWVPDVIILNIGGNDTTQSTFVQADYQKDVVALVRRLHELYPNAVMLWTRTDGSKCGTYAISALMNEGIIKEGYIAEAVIPQVGDDGTYGASAHNSLQTHIDTAQILADYLSDLYNLEPMRENVTMDDYKDVVITG